MNGRKNAEQRGAFKFRPGSVLTIAFARLLPGAFSVRIDLFPTMKPCSCGSGI